MKLIDAAKNGFRNYVNFKGVASRADYWYWVLFTVIVSTILGMIDKAIGSGLGMATNYGLPSGAATPIASIFGSSQFNLLGDIWNLATFLPSLGLVFRRLRDAGYSLKRLWLYLVPVGLVFVGLVLALPGFVSVSPSSPNTTFSILFIIGAILLVLGTISGIIIGILFIVWLTQPSKPGFLPAVPTAPTTPAGQLPDFITDASNGGTTA